MKEDNAMILSEVSPDLFVPPHVLPIVMELFMGEKQPTPLQEEQAIMHLATCQYCRTAIMVLLGTVQEYDSRNNNSQEPVHTLLERFARINTAIETCSYEMLGAYAAAIVAEGRDKADLRFPDVVIHLRVCRDCQTALKETVDFINEQEETG